MLTALLVTSQLLFAAAPAPPRNVFSLADEAFAAQAQADLAQLKIYGSGMRRVLGQLQGQASLFSPKKDQAYTPEEKRTLLTAWGALYDYVCASEGLRARYWDFVKTPPTSGKHAWGFLVTHAALTSELASGLAFAERAAGVPQLEVLLDEPSAEFGLPARAFTAFKEKVIHLSTTTQLLTGDAYAVGLSAQLKKLKLSEREDVKGALAQMKDDSRSARDRLARKGASLFGANAADILKDGTLGAIFPVQKDIAEWMGDTRVNRVNKNLITRAQADELLERMEPGDTLIARQNWFISNVGLPGFWKHAELYIGTPAVLAAAFDADPAVKDWVARQTPKAETLSAWLAAKYPEKWKFYVAGKDFMGHSPIRVIEAISEGVSFTAVDHGMMVDYLGVMRPKLPKVEKAQAIARAFEYQGRPYDFNFDFFSDATIVCTELVYKSYAPSAEMKGLRFALVDVAGRMTLPANEIVRTFDLEYDRPDRQLDFVAFLDGQEGKGAAVSADVAAWRKSWQRVNWDVLQQ